MDMTLKLINKLIILLSSILFLFVLLFSLCFSFLFVQHSYKIENNRLDTKALSLADAISKITPDNALPAVYNNAVLRLVNTLNQNEIWLIDKNTLQISGSRDNPDLVYAQLSTEETNDIQKIFDGQNIRTSSFAPFINPAYTTIGVPVYDRYGEIQAALLLHDKLPTIEHSWYDGIPLALLCSLLIYIICMALLIYLTKKYILSLSVINNFIKKILQHDYSSHIKTKSTDELGEISQNINKLAQYLQQIEQSSKSKAESNYNLIVKTAYKLHTPLKDLKFSLNDLASQSTTSNKINTTDAAKKMLKDVDKLQHIINNLFEISNMDNTEFNMDKSLLNLLEVLKDTIKAQQKYADDKKITLSQNIKLSKELILFTGNSERLKQMFSETLDKAIQLYPTNSTLYIDVIEDDVSYYIYFKNTNTEISVKQLPEFFQQAQDDKPDETLYSSLELNIAQHLASLHDIKLNYQKQPDGYTSFEFVIPK